MKLHEKIGALPPQMQAFFKEQLSKVAAISEASVRYWLQKETGDFSFEEANKILSVLGQDSDRKYLDFVDDAITYQYSASFGIKPSLKAGEKAGKGLNNIVKNAVDMLDEIEQQDRANLYHNKNE